MTAVSVRVPPPSTPPPDRLAAEHAARCLGEREDGRPFLTDFGIATLLTSEQARAEIGRRFGTPEFMAPEQLVGDWESDHRSDIYSLGLVGFNALAGRLPSSRGLLDAPPLHQFAPDVPAALARIIERCLALDPRRRWSNAVALRDALARGTDGAGTRWRRLRNLFS